MGPCPGRNGSPCGEPPPCPVSRVRPPPVPPRPRLLTDLTDRCAACRVFCQGVPAGPALVRPRPLSSSSSPQRRPAQGHQETEGARQRLRHHPRGRHLPHSVRAGGAQHGSHGGAAAGRGTGRLPRGGRGTRVRACVCVRACVYWATHRGPRLGFPSWGPGSGIGILDKPARGGRWLGSGPCARAWGQARVGAAPTALPAPGGRICQPPLWGGGSRMRPHITASRPVRSSVPCLRAPPSLLGVAGSGSNLSASISRAAESLSLT